MDKKYISDDPKLQQYVDEWHPTKNESLTPQNTMKGSGRTIWWQCLEHDNHVWDATPLARIVQKQGCPFCSGNRILAGFNDLATTNPELAQQWHPTLNTEFTSEEVSAFSMKKAFWICPVGEDHIWEASIQSRHKGNSCPYCGNRKVLAGFNDLGSSKEYAHIVKEWHPKNILKVSEVSVAANKKVWWLCEEGHEWEAIIANRTKKGSGCPACKKGSAKKFLQTVAESKLFSEYHEDNPKSAEEITLGTNFPVKWKCKINPEHIWEVSVANRMSGSGCPVCLGRKIIAGINDLASSEEHAHLVEQWHPDNILTPMEVGVGTDVNIKWKCEEGHVWMALIYSRTTNGHGCPECLGRTAWTQERKVVADYPELLSQWHVTNVLDPQKITFRSKQEAVWQCPKNDKHIWTASVVSRSLDGSDCPVCAGRVIVPGVNDLASSVIFAPIANQWHPDNDFSPTEVTPGSNRKAKWQCDKKTSHVWEAVIYARVHATVQRGCPHCAAESQSSLGERELLAVLEKFGFNPDTSVRQLLVGRELDLYLPEKKFAIEFNGLYWHSDSVRPDPLYHSKKLASCTAKGITLFNVWEDDWKYKRSIVIRDLAVRLNVLDKLHEVLPHESKTWAETVGASELTAMKLTKKDVWQFLDTHHIQGATPGELYLGFKDAKNNLRAAMVVSKTNVDGTYRISRYASEGVITNGFAELVKYAEEALQVKNWVILSDLSSSDDSLYVENGFVLDGTVEPDYSYVSRGKRVNKTNYRLSRFRDDRDLLYVDGLGEKALADMNGILRIWDFGKNRYVKEVVR